MAIESLMYFMNDLHQKPELKKILDKSKSDFDSEEAKLEYVVKEAKKHGYDFTPSELKTVLGAPDGELSDDNLSNVAGGGVWQDIKNRWKKLNLRDPFMKGGFEGAWTAFKNWWCGDDTK